MTDAISSQARHMTRAAAGTGRHPAATADYQAFLASKRQTAPATGITVDADTIHPRLFEWQRDIVLWALRRGRAAIFADTGLGKTGMQLEWARHIAAHTGGKVLIVAPLAVSQQTVREGAKFDIPVHPCRTQADVRDGLNITNYEMLQHFDPREFSGLVLDESSILKGFDGKLRRAITDFGSGIPYRLACTATPAPNDLIELTNHAEFLNVMSGKEIIALFFTQDGNTTHAWRLKGHARQAFWRWLASWAVALRKPSDLGYRDDDFNLPALHTHQVTVDAPAPTETLFAVEALTLLERQRARRESVDGRVAACAELVNANTEPWVVWCDLNAESHKLATAIPGAVEVVGSDSREAKEAIALWFEGSICECQLRKNAGHTTAPTTPNTRTAGRNELQRNKPSTTVADVSATRLTPSNSGNTGHMPLNGNSAILKADSLSGSSPTASLQSNTERCSMLKAEDVQFAGVLSPSMYQPGPVTAHDASMLTTATTPDEYAASSARPAISASGSSERMPTSWDAQHCTCGGIKSHRVLISKPSIFGWGLNWQHCAHMAFVGLSDSWEQLYQATRRCWRFGQQREVHRYLITAETEGAVKKNLARKEAQATEMMDELVGHMAGLSLGAQQREEMVYEESHAHGRDWQMWLGDSVELLHAIADESVGLSVFSPPFPGMYAYTNSAHDMGNTTSIEQMLAQFRYLIGPEKLLRVMMPGRMCCIHLTQAPAFKNTDGYVGLKDFRGSVIAMMQEEGWIYYGEVTIDKDPQVKAQRTKERGLMFKTLATDSSLMRTAMADYLLYFMKPGANPRPIRAGRSGKYVNPDGWITNDEWIEWAHPIWRGIRESNVLNVRIARDAEDERHLCPLQLDVIERAIKLWSAPGDLVLDPFAGVGSVGYEALGLGRRFVGIELKRRYFETACRNLREQERQQGQATLRGMAEDAASDATAAAGEKPAAAAMDGEGEEVAAHT